ncbi:MULTISPECIES: hypothetical protein [Streptomycetaceae]|uniref:Uncharacterized protein n=1 Tax=Streptantibioticus cattleyicolor (strain ATCC 35852 / DSM 46488 / JCM 4925 / NBRC 14057 / NRRL 8057) TaxID=1003195 RepID=F8JQ31_STREN|nr:MULTISPECIES: hypothetical protein [Streptomycetaceae]AEW95295.1 hypothetical protein SCATT_29240 [Streptantibioticus cattleyicolor NRRL 8057 = DSM 46488]MYS59876.1 hypothetical protein [Streptomyces sp. SID5468]CCB75638.1 conserved protein of unknown function [Streptantibioticus cattleyicolor NRRL 8057 = DSM 46488]
MSHKGLYVTRFVVPKAGVTVDECEDALCVLPNEPYDALIEGVVAATVCDGATESLLSGEWARMLAGEASRSAVRPEGLLASPAQFQAFAADVMKQWADWLRGYTDRRAHRGQPLQWYEEAKLSAGAHATLLSAAFTPDPDRDLWRWQAAALGDSCLFHIRDGCVLTAHPISSAGDFGNRPELFSSNNRDTELLATRTRFLHGTCVSGDIVLLATDALAAWFLSQPRPGEAAHALTQYARNPGQGEQFEEWVQAQRHSGALRNDDVALIHIDAQGR